VSATSKHKGLKLVTVNLYRVYSVILCLQVAMWENCRVLPLCFANYCKQSKQEAWEYEAGEW